jgi:predicted nucleic acid-binding protein
MRFWDTSAITPLLVDEPDSGLRERQLREDKQMLVWFSTPAEIESALCRRKRDRSLDADAEARARARWADIEAACAEVEPLRVVRDRAVRLLRVHPLLAADAMQLAAALIACSERPRGFGFLTGDDRLKAAAEAEGFVVG